MTVTMVIMAGLPATGKTTAAARLHARASSWFNDRGMHEDAIHHALRASDGSVAATLVPFAEELFFRGLGVRALLPLGSAAALAVTALAFGLGHGLFSALPVLVPFALALGWVRLRSDSVWPGVLAHGFYNGAALLYLYFDLT